MLHGGVRAGGKHGPGSRPLDEKTREEIAPQRPSGHDPSPLFLLSKPQTPHPFSPFHRRDCDCDCDCDCGVAATASTFGPDAVSVTVYPSAGRTSFLTLSHADRRLPTRAERRADADADADADAGVPVGSFDAAGAASFAAHSIFSAAFISLPSCAAGVLTASRNDTRARTAG